MTSIWNAEVSSLNLTRKSANYSSVLNKPKQSQLQRLNAKIPIIGKHLSGDVHQKFTSYSQKRPLNSSNNLEIPLKDR